MLQVLSARSDLSRMAIPGLAPGQDQRVGGRDNAHYIRTGRSIVDRRPDGRGYDGTRGRNPIAVGRAW